MIPKEEREKIARGEPSYYDNDNYPVNIPDDAYITVNKDELDSMSPETKIAFVAMMEHFIYSNIQGDKR